jgi:hypothetical protein
MPVRKFEVMRLYVCLLEFTIPVLAAQCFFCLRCWFSLFSCFPFRRRYEKPLLLQICRLLRGFTHPGTYFDASTEEIALYR